MNFIQLIILDDGDGTPIMDEELGNTPETGAAVPGQIEIVEIAGGSAKKRVVVDTSSSSSDSSSSSGPDKR